MTDKRANPTNMVLLRCGNDTPWRQFKDTECSYGLRQKDKKHLRRGIWRRCQPADVLFRHPTHTSAAASIGHLLLIRMWSLFKRIMYSVQ